jgi:uncharacterized membrane protein
MLVYKKTPLDLLIIFIWIIITLIFIKTPVLAGTFMRTALAIPVVLFIPGYVLIAALFPRNDDMGIVERVALSFGTSIAVVPLLGLLLNFTTGIDLNPILITLCLYTIILVSIAAYRRMKLPGDVQLSIPFWRIYETANTEIKTPRSRKDMILSLSLIFIIAFAVGMVIFVVSTPKIGERFTEFYILGPSGKAENYSANLKYNSPATSLVGVVNHEYSFVNYTVQVALNEKVLTFSRFTLTNNETWEKNITFIPDKEGNGMRLEFWLFKEDNFTVPYRELQLWVNITK